MNNNKPNLIDPNFLNRFIQSNVKKQNTYHKQLLELVKKHFLIILFIGALAYLLYYRYNSNQNKKVEVDTVEVVKEPVFAPQQYAVPKVVDNKSLVQTNFIPGEQNNYQPNNNLPQQTYISQQRKVIDNTPNYSHDINDYNGQNDIDIENMINVQNTIDPINLNQNHYFKNKNNISNQIYNQHDHSLKTRSATRMAPQYLGHNFSQAF
jgi:hypothetical protein